MNKNIKIVDDWVKTDTDGAYTCYFKSELGPDLTAQLWIPAEFIENGFPPITSLSELKSVYKITFDANDGEIYGDFDDGEVFVADFYTNYLEVSIPENVKFLEILNYEDFSDDDKVFLTLSVWYKTEKELTEQELKAIAKAVGNYLKTI